MQNFEAFFQVATGCGPTISPAYGTWLAVVVLGGDGAASSRRLRPLAGFSSAITMAAPLFIGNAPTGAVGTSRGGLRAAREMTRIRHE
jgi:hypothetical protein